MESSKSRRKEREELQQSFKKLEQEWHTIKNSKPKTTSRTKLAVPSNKSIKKPHEYSPRELMYNLQQVSPLPTEVWKNMRTNNMATLEILQERREAIERGKLKGRRLFQSNESALVSSPEREVRSMFSNNSEDESSGSKVVHDHCTRREFSYSSSSCPVGSDNEQDVEVVADLVAAKTEMRVTSNGRRGNGKTRYAVSFGGVAVTLLVVAMFMSFAKSSCGDSCNVILVPT